MTIPRLSGWWDELAPAFNSLSQSIPKIINPNADFQRSVRDQIAANPQLLQQYAEMERKQPGVLKSMGLGRLGDIVKSTPAGLPELIGAEAINAFTTNPQAKEEIVSKAVGTKTSAERSQAKANLEATNVSTERNKLGIELDKIDKSLKEFELETAPLLTKLKREDAVQKLDDLEKYRQAVPVAKAALTKHGNRIFDAWKRGEISSEEIGAINRVPEIKAIWQQGFDVWKEENDQKYRLAMIAAQKEGGTDYETRAKFMNRQHFTDLVINHDPGLGLTPEMISQYLDLPVAVQASLQNMPANAANSPSAQSLWLVGQGVKSYNAATRVKQDKAKATAINSALASRKTQIQTAFDIIYKKKGASTQDKESAISMYNEAMDAVADTYGMYGQVPPKMAYRAGVLGGPKEIVFTNTPDSELEALGKEIGVDLRRSKAQTKIDASRGSSRNPLQRAGDFIQNSPYLGGEPVLDEKLVGAARQLLTIEKSNPAQFKKDLEELKQIFPDIEKALRQVRGKK